MTVDLVTEARRAVARERHRGTLLKPSRCNRCKTSGVRLQGHHADYSKPLDLEWLCCTCHQHEHKSGRNRRIDQSELESWYYSVAEPRGMTRFQIAIHWGVSYAVMLRYLHRFLPVQEHLTPKPPPRIKATPPKSFMRICRECAEVGGDIDQLAHDLGWEKHERRLAKGHYDNWIQHIQYRKKC